ncbi:DUF3866 family protein [Brachybacterium huguangmaarense]|uniref:DUF3866 family protein n=1 Tax=Brachybacterium huguangmaarense TaxID=1652028 RepID=A0ABY6G025_9MICO|nr:DUF3866 family protein [Brachybacterium huguangmaarense]UYG16314.1 DUF3866 family protein [Brachybacterium huguangmaarense]
MMRWERGTVRELVDSWPGVVRMRVALDDGSGQSLRALAYTELLGSPAVGETVLLNTNALRRDLGTGGDALVVARPDAPGARSDGIPVGAAHMMKARYTPGQVMVDAIDDPASQHYATMCAADDLAGMSVVAADLHSSLPAIVAGIRATRPAARVAYVLTDGAALPAWYSRTVAALREAGLLAACVSAGQAFGGDLEAVSVPSALLGARHVVGADVAIAIQGPGNLGTGTGWGFSGLQAADVLNAAGALGGRPIGALRVSDADPRDRHLGLSHHSATTYGRLVHVPTTFGVWPAALHTVFHPIVREQLEETVIAPAAARGLRHEVREVDPDGLWEELESFPVTLSTMGRGLDEDPNAFVYAALAGRAAAQLAP